MIGRIMISVCAVAVLGIFLMGQDCAAQCDPDPCAGIPNAVADSCHNPIPAGLCNPADYTCDCEGGFTWQDATNTCKDGLPFALPDTGQEVCYNNTTVIECPAAGQPFYGQDAQYVSNPMSYTDNGNGTVTDNVTGLMWQREDDDTPRTWDNAISYCEGLTLSGHTDWRLPNEYELQSIVDYGRYDPAIDTTAFPGTNYWYWSSSTCAHYTGSAWLVYFYHGAVYYGLKTDTNHVRCVRGESVPQSFTDNLDGTVTDNETGLIWQQEDDNQTRNWQSALAYCEGLSLGGHSDWRLPDVKELRSIVDNTRYTPAIDTTVFPGTNSGYYWSSSTGASPGYAWSVGFNLGDVYGSNKTLTYYVRCVR